MKRSKLKNKANKTKNPSDIKNYKKQRNYVVQLNKKTKLKYFSNFNSSQVKCKPVIIFKNNEIAYTFNKYFGSIV